jgi:hypothetical protein
VRGLRLPGREPVRIGDAAGLRRPQRKEFVKAVRVVM